MRKLRSVLVVLTMLAMAWQGYLVSAHSHVPGAAGHTVAIGDSIAHHAQRHDRHPSETPDTCPICQSLAMAGTLLPGSGVDLGTPIHIAEWYFVPARWVWVPQQRSHRWNSRGPPAA